MCTHATTHTCTYLFLYMPVPCTQAHHRQHMAHICAHSCIHSVPHTQPYARTIQQNIDVSIRLTRLLKYTSPTHRNPIHYTKLPLKALAEPRENSYIPVTFLPCIHQLPCFCFVSFCFWQFTGCRPHYTDFPNMAHAAMHIRSPAHTTSELSWELLLPTTP